MSYSVIDGLVNILYGGVLPPVYIDSAIDSLRNSGYGLHIGSIL